MPIENWLLRLLVCPRHKSGLEELEGSLVCPDGCEYPVVQGVPVLLRDDVEQTLWVAGASLQKARQLARSFSADPDPCVETLGIDPEECASLAAALRSKQEGVDPVVSQLIVATNGNLYRTLLGRLASYPIPHLRLPPAKGALLLDIGCNWGRWCVAAARRGYRVIGMDPSLGAVLAAQRVCLQLGVNAHFIVGDSRHLPFASHVFDVAFSYSVLQHFAKNDVRVTLNEVARILKCGGNSMIQMPNAYGIRSLYQQARRGFKPGADFDVRYWTRAELKTTFERLLGATSLHVDCFFGLGIQNSDKHMLPLKHKMVVWASDTTKSISDKVHFLRAFADSLYACSVKANDGAASGPGFLR